MMACLMLLREEPKQAVAASPTWQQMKLLTKMHWIWQHPANLRGDPCLAADVTGEIYMPTMCSHLPDSSLAEAMLPV